MIAGLQTMTLLDFPGKVACTLFLQGCNFRCPFCHNSPLLPQASQPFMTEEAFLHFLQSRRGLLDGVCISGGEPTLQPALSQLLRRIRSLGFSVKLDTNGSRPEVLQALMAENLLDYVAMDVKNCPDRYGQTIGLDTAPLDALQQSLRLLLGGQIPFELRTTVVTPLHDLQAMEEMGRWLYQLSGGQKIPRLYLQPFQDRETVLFSGMAAPTNQHLAQWADTLRPFVHDIQIRGL